MSTAPVDDPLRRQRRAGTAVPVRPWPVAGPALPPAPGLRAGPPNWTVTAVDPAVRSATAAAAQEAAGAPVWRDPEPTGSARVDAPAGWSATGDGVTWEHDDTTAAVRVFDQLDSSGNALFARLTTVGPVGSARPDVVHLPDELADGLLLTRRELHGGTLALRVDAVRRAWDLEVLVSTLITEPATADDVVTALVRLLAAVAPAGQDGDA